MQTLKVELGERSYPIHIGEGLLDRLDLLAPHIAGRQVAIVSNATVAPLYLERLTRTLSTYNVLPVVLPDGEAFKNWETLQTIFDALLTARHDRRTTVIALPIHVRHTVRTEEARPDATLQDLPRHP